MLHASLAGFILAWVYTFLDKKHSKQDEFHAEIDWWMGFAVVIVSSVAITVSSFGIVYFELPMQLTFISYLFYLLIPFIIFRLMLDYKSKKAFLYSLWVPFIAILAEIPFVIIQGVLNAQ